MLAWVDLETTGLDPRTDRVLEIACIVTDINLSPVDEEPFHSVVYYDPDHARHLRDAVADDYVRRMHDATDLWGKLPEGTPIGALERNLLAYIRRHAPQPRQARLAGNSVRLDANFLDAALPQVAGHLHYRLLDVSGIAYLANEWAGVPYFDKQRTHSALDDIRESLAELRHLRAAGMFPATSG